GALHEHLCEPGNLPPRFVTGFPVRALDRGLNDDSAASRPEPADPGQLAGPAHAGQPDSEAGRTHSAQVHGPVISFRKIRGTIPTLSHSGKEYGAISRLPRQSRICRNAPDFLSAKVPAGRIPGVQPSAIDIPRPHRAAQVADAGPERLVAAAERHVPIF